MTFTRVEALATCRQALNVCLHESDFSDAEPLAAVVARDVRDAGGVAAVLRAVCPDERLSVLERVAQAASVNVACWRFAVEAEANPDLQSGDLVARSRARMHLFHAKSEANRACLGLTAAVDAYHAFEVDRVGTANVAGGA